MQTLQGIGVSSGVALGAIVFLTNDMELGATESLGSTGELERLSGALDQARQQTESLVEQLRQAGRDSEAEIFTAHGLMIDDPEIHERTRHLIENENQNASYAYQTAMNEFIQMMEAMDDEYLRHRAVDLRDISQRVLKILNPTLSSNAVVWPDQSILVCDDLTPSQAATLDLSRVKGFITQKGSKTSHTAILARAREIPAVLGVGQIFTHAKDGQIVGLDGSTGQIFIEPNADQKHLLAQQAQKHLLDREQLKTLLDQPAVTRDGFAVVLAANIAQEQDLPSVLDNGATAVGLYRTEFLFLDKTQAPSEEEQTQVYRRVLAGLPGKKVFIRTIDIGGDKRVPYLSVGEEENPFLGNRAVRMCLRDPEFFKTQLRAILRAAAGFEVGVMVPMISNIEEIKRCKELILECQSELAQSQMTFAEKIEFGIMIEVPSAALLMDHVVKYVDFVSIGTNDLTQYVCAVDRMNSEIQDLYDSAHPGLLRLMDQIIGTARKHNVFVGICGSVAHDPDLLPVWLGMGVSELSMTAQHIPSAKAQVRGLSHQICRDLAKAVLTCETSSAVRALLRQKK